LPIAYALPVAAKKTLSCFVYDASSLLYWDTRCVGSDACEQGGQGQSAPRHTSARQTKEQLVPRSPCGRAAGRVARARSRG
jgi:hypothetical protein